MNNLPHLLFYGPPGTGKTSAILALAKQMFGPDLYKDRLLELNASDDRGISVVRDKIKKFAQRAVVKDSNYPSPSFKIIVLDEADSLTGDAQAALRRVIEKYTKVTRFCLICNYISKIIDPLASRCVKFRFKPISKVPQVSRLSYISNQEGLEVTHEVLDSLVDLTEGDMRRSITTLQSTSKLYGTNITREMIREVSAIIPPEVIESIYTTAQKDFDSVKELCDELMYSGFQPDVLLSQLFDYLVSRPEISDIKKSKLSEVLAEADWSLTSGGSEVLVLQKALTSLQIILKN